MEMDPNPPSFNIPMSVQPLNLGEAYSKGMAAGTSAGEQLGKGISAAFDVYQRSRTVDDVLQALNQQNILGDEAYKSVANKSLGAKEAIVGMYSGAWMAQQKAQIDANIAIQKAAAEQEVLHPGQRPIQPARQPQQPAGQQRQPTGGPAAPPPPLLPGMQPLGGYTGTPTPLGSTDITNPYSQQPAPVTVGEPIGANEQVPPGSKIGTLQGQSGILWPDRKTFRPFKKSS